MDYYKKDSCKLCESNQLECVFELTPSPPGNHFVTEDALGSPQESYPLTLDFCNNCGHLQLGHVVDPKILYQQNYSYVSATSPVFVDHLRDYADEVVSRYNFSDQSLVIDIGSNDGTALSFFQKKGLKVLGIDPANEIVEAANKNNIETLCEFFSLDVAKKYASQYGKATLINSHNACAHIDDLRGVVEGVKYWLADDGLFVVEVGYLMDVYENAWFDTIYHEHLDYHTVAPLVSFFNQLDMQVIDVQRTAPQGGSIRLTVQKSTGTYSVDKSVEELIELEQEKGLDQAETFIKFSDRITKISNDLSSVVNDLKAQGKSIAGFGAPTKATTLLTHFNLSSALDFLVDENKLKQGLYSPGSHIPVYSADVMYDKKPDYVLILAWNFAENIMSRHQAYKEQGGQFILPMPEVKIV